MIPAKTYNMSTFLWEVVSGVSSVSTKGNPFELIRKDSVITSVQYLCLLRYHLESKKVVNVLIEIFRAGGWVIVKLILTD